MSRHLVHNCERARMHKSGHNLAPRRPADFETKQLRAGIPIGCLKVNGGAAETVGMTQCENTLVCDTSTQIMVELDERIAG